MLISGIQKLSLLDYPDKTCATVFTFGCNFRCPFCHNSDLVVKKVADRLINEDEIFSFFEKRKGLLDAVTISGGEPLLQRDIISFADRVKSLGYLVKIDTNGSQTTMLQALIKHVDFVAMDIKNSPSKYAKTVGLPAMDINAILKSADIIMNSAVDYEFRTTVAKELHTIDDITEIAKWLNGAKRYSLQNFKNSESVIDSSLTSVSDEWMREAAEAARFAFDEVIIK